MKSDTLIYPVGESTVVTLRVTYGEGQPGSTVTTWQANVRSVPEAGASYENGGGSLRGLILFCKSSVMDENPATNRTSVTYHLSGGVQDQAFTYEVIVPTHGAIAEYAINFVFV